MSSENLTIGKKDYLVKLVELRQADLRFYQENPRVYSALNMMGGEPTQEEIEEYMCNQDSVKQLRISIESNGGLIDPLIVKEGDLTVLEGNSRLAAYRILSQVDPLKWGMVKCKLLPSDIDESAIFTLLGQYHIIGRKDWEPFEQAHYLYRRRQKTRLPIEYMADELGLSKQKASKMIDVIEFMIAHDDLNKRNWSYYEEYLKNASIKKYRDTNPDIDEKFTEYVKSSAFKQAADVRKLGDIAKVGDKQSKKIMQKFAKGEISLYEGYENLLESGKLDDGVKKLKYFKELISENAFEKQLTYSKETWEISVFEIRKIIKRLEAIRDKYEKDL